MSDYTKVPTTREVADAIRTAHPLEVFASFSDPTGTFMDGSGETGRMETGYGIKGTDYPLLWMRTVWAISEAREDRTTEYWLCIGRKED